MKKYLIGLLLLCGVVGYISVTNIASASKECCQSDVQDTTDVQNTTEDLVIVAKPQKTEMELHLDALGLVDIEAVSDDIHVDLMYARDDNFTGKVLYHNLNRAYLHPEAADALLAAQAELKKIRPDLSLKVYDATRPLSVQQTMWDCVKGTPDQMYVSNPANGGGLHNYALAVDVTLCNAETGDTLSMGTHIDYFGEMAQVKCEQKFLESKRLTQEAYQNRLLLRQVMTSAGYKVLNTEWWHFNFKTKAEAKANYKVIE